MERLLTLTLRGHCILCWLFSLICSINLLYALRLEINPLVPVFLLVLWLSLNQWTCSRPDRIIPIAERFGMDPGAVLDNVMLILWFTNTLFIICFLESHYQPFWICERSYMLVLTHMSISTTCFLVWQRKWLKSLSGFWWAIFSTVILMMNQLLW